MEWFSVGYRWIIVCFKKYFVFTGRATRPELWYFLGAYFLFSTIFLVLLGWAAFFLIWALTIIPKMAVMTRRLHDTDRSGVMLVWYYVMVFIWALPTMLAWEELKYMVGDLEFLGDVILHPIGMLYFLLSLVVLVGYPAAFLVLFCDPTDILKNQYGPVPKKTLEPESALTPKLKRK